MWTRTDRLFRRSDRSWQAGELETAVECLDDILSQDARNAHALLRRGQILSDLGRYSAAVASLESAQSIEPENHAIQMYLGVVHLDHGDVAQAGRELDKAADLDPGNEAVRAYKLLASYDLGVTSLGDFRDLLPGMPLGAQSRLVLRLEKVTQVDMSSGDAESTATRARVPQNRHGHRVEHVPGGSKRVRRRADSLEQASRDHGGALVANRVGSPARDPRLHRGHC